LRRVVPGTGGPALRIVQVVCTSEFAGVERALTYVAPELARRGHDVTVIGGDPGRMVPPLTAAGVEHVAAPDLLDAVRSVAERRRDRPDLVHSHMTSADVVAIGTKPFHHAATVSTLHFAQPRGGDRTRRVLYRALPPFIGRQIAISRFVAEHCNTPTVVVPNGVPDRSAAMLDRQPIVFVAQRFEREKDTALALRIWQRASLRAHGWRMEVAGRGKEEVALRSLATRLGLDDSVTFLGFVEHVDAIMARSSVLLATAPAEPFGLSVVEAMAAGLPVVAADGGGHHEVLAGFEGQLFRPGDSDAGAAALDELAGNATALDTARTRARQRYEAKYTIEKHVDQLLDVYAAAVR
jgi:glycosyltransferase involved in cell wall biosynthesis